MVGETGTGKSTLLRAINGLVPHFSGGVLAGTVTVDGRTTKDNRPRDLADVVGFVGQNPLATFVTETVEDELAYTMENLGCARRCHASPRGGRGRPARPPGPARPLAAGAVGWPTATCGHRGGPDGVAPHAGARRADVRPRSGGGRRGPQDAGPPGARSRSDRGHGRAPARARGAVRRPDRPGARRRVRRSSRARPRSSCASSSVAPPLVELGRLVGWDPLPLSVRDARRQAGPAPRAPRSDIAPRPEDGARRDDRSGRGGRGPQADRRVRTAWSRSTASTCRSCPGRGPRPDGEERLRQVDAAHARCRAHDGRPVARWWWTDGTPDRFARAIWSATWDSCRRIRVSSSTGRASRPSAAPPTRCPRLDDGDDRAHARADPARHAPAIVIPATSPRANGWPSHLAIVVAPAPALLLLDEPTRGLDYPSKDRLIEVLRELAEDGHAIVLATHDVELAARVGGPGRRPGGRPGHHGRPGPPGGLPFPDLRPSGGQGAGARRMADGGRSAPGPRRSGAGMTVSVPRPAPRPGRRLTPGDPDRHPLLLPALADHALRRRRLRLAADDPSVRGPEHRPQRRRTLDLRRPRPAPVGHRHGRALRRSDRCQGGGAARDPRRLLRRAPGAESRHQRFRARMVPPHPLGAGVRAGVRFRPRAPWRSSPRR